jgi:FkbM family methyltransferase
MSFLGRFKHKLISSTMEFLVLKLNYGQRLAIYGLSTESALKRVIKRGVDVKSVVDVGASDGSWSKNSMKILPNANYFLVEAQSNHKEKLDTFKSRYKNVDFKIVAAGNYNGTIQFDTSDLYGGIALEGDKNSSFEDVPIMKLDTLIDEYRLQAPFLLKLDTHGFEKQIFEGAETMLKQTNLIIVEAYNFEITPGCMRFHELCTFLESKGFRCIDISEPIFRLKDESFWQIDLFFIKSSRKEFDSIEYE